MSETRDETVGFVGLGNMGGPLAARLAAEMPLIVCDRSSERVTTFVGSSAHARAAATPADLGQTCTLVFTCLPTSEHVREVIFGNDGLRHTLQPSAMIIDMTTGNPDATRAMATELAPAGITLIDAPVSGGPRGAREGTIAIMVGGTAEDFSRVAAVLGVISRNVAHVGAVGAGHAIKAGNNLLNLICRMATYEVVSLLVKDGVDPGIAVETIQKSSGRNYATEITLPDNILSGTLHQGFTTALMQKDASVAIEIANAHGLDMPFGDLAQAVLERVIDEHGHDADMSAVALTYEQLTGARIRPTEA